MTYIGKIINWKQLCYLTISSCVSVRTSVEILSTREVWRARKRRGAPNFPSVQYLDIRTALAWTNCFIITLSKRSMQQNFIILYYCRARSKQYNVYVTIFFSLTVNLMFLSGNWEKVYSKMIVKSIFWCQKNINLRKVVIERKQLCKEWSHAIVTAQLAEMTTTTTLTSFPYYRLTNSNVSS